MRLHAPSNRQKSGARNESATAIFPSTPQRPLTAAEEPLKRAPSQKELANIFGITTRHLRRWEDAEAAANRPCSRPYTAADLWRLYQRRHPKGWNRDKAARLALAPLFERFVQMLEPGTPVAPSEEQTVTVLMLKSLAWETANHVSGALPRALGASLAQSAKVQLRTILDCGAAREILVRAFFEAALVADAKHIPAPTNGAFAQSA